MMKKIQEKLEKRHPYDRKSIHSIEYILTRQIDPLGNMKLDSNIVECDGDLIRMDSHRYWVFAKKGTTCACCGMKAQFFAKERSHSKNKNATYHFNLYGVNENGKEILFTKDHIKPKSKGGIDDISNYNPMCTDCNGAKGNSYQEVV